MASDKQLIANRANAMRSTGPKTAAGKALSRMNANKHGLTAETIVIGDEDPNEFYSFREELGEEWQPRPGMESALVDRLAEQIWRLRRAPVFEAALFQVRRASLAAEKNYHGEPVYEPEEYMGYALINDARYGDTLGKLSRYEAGLMNGYAKTLRLLLVLQNRRIEEKNHALGVEAHLLPKTEDAASQ